jgi:hypothetical protein
MLDRLRNDGLLNERLDWEGRPRSVSEAAQVTTR